MTDNMMANRRWFSNAKRWREEDRRFPVTPGGSFESSPDLHLFSNQPDLWREESGCIAAETWRSSKQRFAPVCCVQPSRALQQGSVGIREKTFSS